MVGWFAIVTQYFLMMGNRLAPIGETTMRFFSFFTILTNLIVAIYFTVMALQLKNKTFKFFSRSATCTAITIYILVVGLVYQVVLRQIWQPQGLQRIVDELLHTLIPFMVLLYWFLYYRRSVVSYRVIPAWLIYPLCYLIFILVRGYYSGFYPYPFMHVINLGAGQVLKNSLVLLAFFTCLSWLFVFLPRVGATHTSPGTYS